MTERPILFNAPMVRAILDGRKTQTRRILGNQEFGLWLSNNPFLTGMGGSGVKEIDVGDLLWVRETWRTIGDRPLSECIGPEDVDFYATTDEVAAAIFTWKPSIHMPRWASRIMLRVTGVKVERLKDISEADAIAEGVEPLFTEHEKATVAGLNSDQSYGWKNYLWHGHVGRSIRAKQSNAWQHQFSSYESPIGSFSSLWESINGTGSWDTNPWVAVHTFERVKP